MILNEREIIIPGIRNHEGLLEYLSREVSRQLAPDEIPVRFVVTQTDSNGYQCELGVLSEADKSLVATKGSIFDFNKRAVEDIDQFNVVLLVPTGIGAEIGGHSGDAGPIARLLSGSCDNLITHPNVVNASDINELPENSLYVEGSVISRLLMGTIGLQKVRSNRVMVIIDKHCDKFFREAAINSVSAARAAFGLNCPEVVMIEINVLMRALSSRSGRAVGRVERFEYLCKALEKYKADYDAVALSSVINVPWNYHEDYFRIDDMLNPWGGVEAMLTHTISTLYNIPSAHSPMMESQEIMNLDVGVVDPRKSAEAVSTTYLHCILKGLHKSPRIITSKQAINQSGVLNVSDISCLVIPYGCVGLPTLAALEQGIPVIAVKENKNRMQNRLEDLPFAPQKLFIVDNYLEAVGVITALKTGVALETVKRPLDYTSVHEIECKIEDLESLPSTRNAKAN